MNATDENIQLSDILFDESATELISSSQDGENISATLPRSHAALIERVIDKYIWNGEWFIVEDDSKPFSEIHVSIGTFCLKVISFINNPIFPINNASSNRSLIFNAYGILMKEAHIHKNNGEEVIFNGNTRRAIAPAGLDSEDIAYSHDSFAKNFLVPNSNTYAVLLYLIGRLAEDDLDNFSQYYSRSIDKDMLDMFARSLIVKADTELRRWIYNSERNLGDVFGEKQLINATILYKFNMGSTIYYLFGFEKGNSIVPAFAINNHGEYCTPDHDGVFFLRMYNEYKRTTTLFKVD